MAFFGEPEWGATGERPVSENRLGGRTFLMGEYSDYSTGRSFAGKHADNDITPLAIPEAGKPQGSVQA